MQERPNPWMHHCLESLLEVAGSSLRVLKLDFAWQLPFTDRLLASVGRLCPNLEHFKVTGTNYFMTDAAVSSALLPWPVSWQCLTDDDSRPALQRGRFSVSRFSKLLSWPPFPSPFPRPLRPCRNLRLCLSSELLCAGGLRCAV